MLGWQRLSERLKRRLTVLMLGAGITASAQALPVRVEGTFAIHQERYEFMPAPAVAQDYPAGPWYVDGRPDVLQRLGQSVRDANQGLIWGTVQIRATGTLSEAGEYGPRRYTRLLTLEGFDLLPTAKTP